MCMKMYKYTKIYIFKHENIEVENENWKIFIWKYEIVYMKNRKY